MRRRFVAVAVAATAASCASDGREPSAPAGAAGLDAGVAEALEALPAGEPGDLTTVTYGDLAAAAEIAGLTPPPDPSDDEAVIDYVAGITGGVRREGDPDEVAATLPRFADSVRYGETQQTVEDIGFSILEVDRFVERSLPETVAVVEGEVDGARMAEVLADAGDGVWVAGDPDGAHLDDTSPARPTGAPLWLHREDGRVIVTGSERDMAAARQADGGEGTLAADETLADLAHALDAYDVYAATLVTGGRIGEGRPEQLAACSGITGTAVGAAHDGRPLIVLAVASASADAAVTNEEPIRGALRSSPGGLAGPWSDVLDLETIGTEGTVTTITMRPADVPTAVWRSLMLDRSFLPC